ncbi:hypothetical protein [Alicyclobacillus sp. SO9]|uniref:hypothetical protein n=1 Tax=Alicyclobacillus sp. SO9 TaxID=2665646 RepID=UPI0018E7CB31|nr:hypothetical protein [Alicyclobacillus sp. SO9]QQE77715.1 hypothetical protein GI364_17510 [Alicyclobacillus sp. SO9]
MATAGTSQQAKTWLPASNRLYLQRGLGILWLIAGLLQAQPLMFTTDFYAWYPSSIMESLLQNAVDGGPRWLVAIGHAGSAVWSTHPILFNVLVIVIQILLGLSLLVIKARKSTRFILWISIVWAIPVWVFGEGMGGFFTASSYFEGLPGAAFMYAVSAIILLLPEYFWEDGQAIRWMSVSTGMYWGVSAVYQVVPAFGYWGHYGLMELFGNSSSLPQPAILSLPIQSAALAISHHAVIWNAIFSAILILLAMASFRNRWTRLSIWLTLLWLAWSWWFGEDFGGIFSGLGTDVNTIPVVGLWMVVLWRSRSAKLIK